ncbi:MAG TPA: histidine--tRNA ligase [Ktedonobacterales bacterium]|nr:histidine--tRNA ligase [Ktedonobacterales bacterium]
MGANASPARGMRDLLPREVEIRDAVTATILGCYQRYGFTRIETPALERIELLSSGEGGENEKMIYKVLKRGEKLDLTGQGLREDDLVDLGLRYDLTVPLARYYANNVAKLPAPFKAIQIGPVWRAERPQAGRYRQFIQCDIDILGEASELAEIELVGATAEAITALGFTGFTVRINDRQILFGLADACGFAATDFGSVFITLDKLDKVGLDGVRAELESKAFAAEPIERLMRALSGFSQDRGDFAATRAALPEGIPTEPLNRLERIIAVLASQAGERFSLVFDPTLVRGMGYYTGTIFEIEAPGYSGSIAGGGRYDKMIGKLLGRAVPACGFSIGFERLMQILEERGYAPPTGSQKLALLFDAETDDLAAVLATASTLREQGYVVNMQPRQKKMRRQLDELSAQGYTTMALYRAGDALPEIKPLEGHG